MRLCDEFSVNGCMHVLLAVHCEGIYDEVRLEILSHYGEGIFNKAENELYNSRVFQIITK